MTGSMRWRIAGLALGIAWLATMQPALAATEAAKGPPPNFVAPAEPKPDETNAQRARTQPGNNAPYWREVRGSGDTPGYTSLPGVEEGVLIQRFVQYPGSRVTNAGEAWRQVRNGWIIPVGGAIMLVALGVLAAFYFWKGPLGGHEPDTGRTIERFTYLERFTHWSVAITFVILGVSGIVMAFGKFWLLPVIGSTLFGWLTYALKTLHNVVGPLFALSLLLLIVLFIRDNIPRSYDVQWLVKAGGFMSGKEIPSHRFNAGEKLIFWGGVIFLGVLVVASGFVLDKLVPDMTYTRGQMQIGHLVHSVASVLMLSMFFFHMYLGSIGMKGAYNGMVTGQVDESWAKEHHELWYDDIKAGRIPAQRSTDAKGVGRPAGAH